MFQPTNDERLRKILREQSFPSDVRTQSRSDADLEELIMRRVAVTPQCRSVSRRFNFNFGLTFRHRSLVAGSLGALAIASFVMVPTYCGHSSLDLSSQELADLDVDIANHWAELGNSNTSVYADLNLE